MKTASSEFLVSNVECLQSFRDIACKLYPRVLTFNYLDFGEGEVYPTLKITSNVVI